MSTDTPLCEAMKNLLKAIEEIPPKANELHLLHAYDALLKALPSEKVATERPCTCHPDDNPPVPCPRKYALSECRKADSQFDDKLGGPERNATLRELIAEIDRPLWRAAAHARLDELEAQLSATDATAKDAERYRWLRNPPPGAHEHLAVCTQDEALFEEQLDAAIDAAMGAVDSGNH